MLNVLMIIVIAISSPTGASLKLPRKLNAPVPSTEIIFSEPEGMSVMGVPGMRRRCEPNRVVAPCHVSFAQGTVYGLKMANIQGHPSVELYSTLEVDLANPRTAAFLAANAVPIIITGEDVGTVLSGRPIVKVTYLPAPEFQELAWPVETISSYRLSPDSDPIVEAARRGDIMVVLRIEPRAGNAIESANGTRPTRACCLARCAGRLRCRLGRR